MCLAQQFAEVVFVIAFLLRDVLLQRPAITVVCAVLVAIDSGAVVVVVGTQHRTATHVLELDVSLLVHHLENGIGHGEVLVGTGLRVPRTASIDVGIFFGTQVIAFCCSSFGCWHELEHLSHVVNVSRHNLDGSARRCHVVARGMHDVVFLSDFEWLVGTLLVFGNGCI